MQRNDVNNRDIIKLNQNEASEIVKNFQSCKFSNDDLINWVQEIKQSGKDPKKVSILNNSFLSLAILYDRLPLIKYLIDSCQFGVNDKIDFEGKYFPLPYACFFGRFDTVKFLLESGADPCATIIINGVHKTPAMIASERGFLECKNIIDQYAHNQEFSSDDFDKAFQDLCHPSQNGILNTIEQLDPSIGIDKGTSQLNLREKFLNQKYDEQIANLFKKYINEIDLIDYLENEFCGEKLKDVRVHNRTLLSFAIESNRLKVVEYLIEKCQFDINETSNFCNGFTPLHESCFWKNAENGKITNYLLTKNADPSKVIIDNTNNYVTAYDLARKNKNATCKIIIENHLELQKFSTETLMKELVYLMNNPNDQTIIISQLNLLVENGINLKEIYFSRKSLLNHALIRDYEQVVSYLIDYGFNSNQGQIHGTTNHYFNPLILACSMYKPKMVKTLLQKGADPKFKLPSGEIVIDLIRKQPLFSSECLAVIELHLNLTSIEAPLNRTNTFTATFTIRQVYDSFSDIRVSNEDLIGWFEQMKNLGVNLKDTILAGESFLSFAIKTNRTGIALYLIEQCQFDVNGQCNVYNKDAALHIACFFGHNEFVDLLLQNGADPNKLNGLQKNAFQIAKEQGHHVCAQMVQNKISEQTVVTVSPYQTNWPIFSNQSIQQPRLTGCLAKGMGSDPNNFKQ